MRTQAISLACMLLLLSAHAFGQWIHFNGPGTTGTSCFATNGAALYAGDLSDGVFRSTDSGTTWVPVNSGLTLKWINVLLTDGTSMYVGTDGAGVFRSTDGGMNWTAPLQGLPKPARTTSLAVLGSSLFAGMMGMGLYSSTDKGAIWVKVQTGFPDSYIYALAVMDRNIYAGTSGGVFTSGDSGATWIPVNNGFPKTSDGYYPQVNAFAVVGRNLFAVTSNWNVSGGVYLSTDNGTSWTAASNGLPKGQAGYYPSVNALAPSGVNLFAGTEPKMYGEGSGVFLSTDSGTSWSEVDTGLTEKDVFALAVSGNNLFAANRYHGQSTGTGFWRRPLSEVTTSVEPPYRTAFHFSLGQNYPNPFNPSTSIKYELPKTSEVRLSVYDMLGREVSVLVNERRDAGVHDAKFDAAGLSSGVYFYRLQAGDFIQTRKLLLVR